MKKIVVVGAGKIGAMIAELLSACGDYAVTVLDHDDDQLTRLQTSRPVQRRSLDIADEQALEQALDGSFAVLNAGPFHLTTRIATSAKAAGAHYLDLTEDVASTRLGAQPGGGRGDRLHPAMRAGARLHHHRRSRPRRPLRQPERRAACGWARCRNIRPMRSATT